MSERHKLLIILFTVLFPLAAWISCHAQEEKSDIEFRVETVAEGLISPWAIEFLPDGRMLVSERPGRLRVFIEGRLLEDPIAGVPEVAYRGQGGLLDIADHPDFEQNGWIYLAYTVFGAEDMMTRISRFKLTPDGLTDQKIIFEGVPGSGKAKHFGCRMVFDDQNRLYFTLGERGQGYRAQDLTQLNGKTLRINDDGSIPEDNPFVGREDARPEIYTYGNRNSQGMAIQPSTGLIWQTEHGPSWNDAPGGGDEVNIIEAGNNYGWPKIHHEQTQEDMLAPILEYTPAIAPSGCCFYTGDLFPQWQGDFFFANLVGEAVYRIDVDGREVLGQEVMLKDKYGRLRDIEEGPDGHLYILTSQTDAYGPGREGGDRLLRLVPVR